MSYTGKITTSGSSEAIRLEKDLFKQNPEFAQRAEVRADIIGPGKMLISVLGEAETIVENDPIVGAFLSFIEKDMPNEPASFTPLSTDGTGSETSFYRDEDHPWFAVRATRKLETDIPFEVAWMPNNSFEGKAATSCLKE